MFVLSFCRVIQSVLSVFVFRPKVISDFRFYLYDCFFNIRKCVCTMTTALNSWEGEWEELCASSCVECRHTDVYIIQDNYSASVLLKW